MTSQELNHIWTRDELVTVTRCYLDNKSLQDTYALLSNIKFASVQRKYVCCLSLDKGSVLQVTKMHLDVWFELKGALLDPVPEENSMPEADGETYFMCAGTCGRVHHYEDTNEFEMCGTCEYKSQKKGYKK